LLTADLVRARKRQGRLHLTPLKERGRHTAIDLAGLYLELAREHVGKTRGELDAALQEIPVSARDRKIALGIRKLVEDRCEFGAATEVDPIAIRREVFQRAAEARQELPEGELLDREAVLDAAAAALEMERAAMEASLYADLRDAQVLRGFDPSGPVRLVDGYELAQSQAVLLRALKVVAHVSASDPSVYRTLFRKLKFRRLLCTVVPVEGGYRIEIDGPMSLFTAGTKYGLALALVLPAIMECDRWHIEAELAWGKARERLAFQLEGSARGEGDAGSPLPDDVARLLEQFDGRKSSWAAAPSSDILTLPGVGMSIPDMVFTHRKTGETIYLEVMGYWSRDAVWKRVELVEQGLGFPIVFAVSSRLRVSEKVLGDEHPAALYVYKGVMSPKAIEERLDRIATRA
jgi:hypothetical protein